MSRDWIYKFLVVAGGGAMLWASFQSPCVSGERQIDRCRGDLLSVSSALELYALNAGRPPTTEQGLGALVTRPTLEPLPVDWVQVAEKVPMDPWMQPYHYRLLFEADEAFRWELRSSGPDGIAGNEDDLAREFDWKER